MVVTFWAFRVLRTNLEFMIGKDQSSNVIAFLAKGHPSFQGVLFNTLTHNADGFADKR